MGATQTKDVKWLCTNENLEAIILGLDPQPDDVVLAVCGSGDQAFAILEYVESVVAFDISTAQINFAIQRKRALGEGNYTRFLCLDELSGHSGQEVRSRKKYFLKEGRLERIRRKLDSLLFRVGDITNAFFGEATQYSKVYLSNILTDSDFLFNSPPRVLSAISANLSTGSLVYDPSGPPVLREETDLFITLPQNLEIEFELTHKARLNERSIYRYSPVVYIITS